MRLINADDKLLRAELFTYTRDKGMKTAINAIDKSPTIDAVEVVRCKDCLNRDNSCGMGEHKWCRLLKQATSPYDYCSYGERRKESEVEK